MNRAFVLLLAAFVLLLPGSGLMAQSGARVVSHVAWVEEWDPATGAWVRVEDSPATVTRAAYEPVSATVTRAGATIVTETIAEQAPPVRFIAGAPLMPAQAAGIAAFGPFRVIDAKRAALVAPTDAASPQAFAAMMAAHPGLAVIEFVDAPGTSHDLANLRLGRAIRAAGLATHVPAGGSARSGAVELFLAGTRRTVDPGALFAVHSWRDERGREPADFAPDAPENRLYLDYYAEMGMSETQARDFYAMTNSVPHAGALWLEGAEMTRWIAPAKRSIEIDAAAAVRFALTRAGATLGAALRTPLPFARAEAPAPRLAYGFQGAGLLDGVLLDSGVAFP
jgi:hypothetical protein